MFTVQEFVSKFETYNDVELFEIHSNWDNYSNEAKEAFHIVISKKGGLDNLLTRMAERHKLLNEANKIKKEVYDLSKSGGDKNFAKGIIASDHLSADAVNEIIDSTFNVIEQEKEDVKIKPRTIYGSILGGALASIISGILWGLLMIYSEKAPGFMLIAPALICYWIIKAFTKQSKNNIVILIATIISICAGIFIGLILLALIGHHKITG
jgi:hypothetical protein